MDQSSSSRLELLRAVARKGEQDLALQRQLVEDLRVGGHRTIEAETFLQRLEASHEALLAKLDMLSGDEEKQSSDKSTVVDAIRSRSRTSQPGRQ